MLLRHAAAVALWAAAVAHAAAPEGGLKLTALAGAPVAHGEERSARATFEPSLKWTLPTVDLRADVRLRWLDQQGGQRTDVDVRELTAAWRANETTFTLGAQQLNWGRMDILRVSDVVNSVDLHDYFYEELPEAKLALWMANLEWQSGTQSLQIMATPQVPVDRVPAFWGGLPVRILKPSSSLGNSTVAIRYGFEAQGWNADLIAARGWQTTPKLQPVVDAEGLHLLGTLSRQNSVGFSADRPFGATVLRLEGLFARVMPDGVSPTVADPGPSRQASLGAGLDVRAGAWFFAGQLIAQHDGSAPAGAVHNAYVSAIVQRKWLQDRLSARLLHIRESHAGSSWSSLQATYELSPHQLVQLQGDVFRGEPTDPFGSFSGRSRIAVSMRFLY